MPTLSLLRPVPLRKRLWQAAGALLILATTFLVGNFCIPADKSVRASMLGHDFLAFYTGATFANTGEYQKLYDLNATRDFELATAPAAHLDFGKSFGPFWNPPFYAIALSPLANWPYRSALASWTFFNVACLIFAMALLIRMLPEYARDWKNSLLIPILMCVSMPFVQAISHGQNTFASLLLLCAIVTAWRARRPLLAGIFCGLLCYKPQLAAIVAGICFLSMGPRVLIGMGMMLCGLLFVTTRIMPDAIADYLVRLPANLQFMQIDNAYLWERHVTLRAFWRMLFQGRGPGETSLLVTSLAGLCMALIGGGLIVAWWKSRSYLVDDVWTGETRSRSTDRLITATICAMPLLMPFYFDYDLLLLAVPATLLASEMLTKTDAEPRDRRDKFLIRLWMALYVWLMFNPPLAGASGVNVSVILLSCVAISSILRACRGGVRTIHLEMPSVHRVLVKRAA